MFYKRIAALWRTHHFSQWVETGAGSYPHCSLTVGFVFECRCFSCDVSPEFVGTARERFGPGSKVSVMEMESKSFLRGTIQALLDDSPTVFFLDAHYPGLEGYRNDPDTIAKTPDFPLWDELQIIKEHRNTARDIILCDDIRSLAGDPANPRWDAGEIPVNHPLANTEHTWREYTGLFSDTHHAVIWPEFEGVLAYIPRGE